MYHAVRRPAVYGAGGQNVGGRIRLKGRKGWKAERSRASPFPSFSLQAFQPSSLHLFRAVEEEGPGIGGTPEHVAADDAVEALLEGRDELCGVAPIDMVEAPSAFAAASASISMPT